MATALAACGSNASSGSPSSAASGGGSGKPKGTLVVDKSFDLKSFDPARTYEPTGLLLERPVYDTLLTFRKGDVKKPVPMVAESVDTSDDAKTFTFRLRDDVKFSDGSPLTADDVVFSLRRVKNVKGSPSFLLDGLSVSSSDPRTVVLESETPNAAVPAIVTNPALGVVNSKVVRENGGDDSAQAARRDKAERFLERESAGSGPYQLDSYSATTQTTLKPNTAYWGQDKPQFERIVARNVQAPTQKLNVQQGDSQLALDLSGDQVVGLDRTLQVKTTASPNIIFLHANADPKITEVASKPEYWKALRSAIDYDGFVELGGRGARRAAGVVPSMFVGALAEDAGPKQDLPAAQQAAKSAAVGGDVPTLEYPSDLTVNGLSFGPLAQRLQANLEKAGLKVKLKPTPVATALDRYRTGKEQLGLWYWGPDYPDPNDYLVFTPGNLVGLRAGWEKGADQDLESMAVQAAKTTGEARVPIFQEIQRRLNATSPFFPLMQPPSNLVAAKDLRNLTFNSSWTVDLASLDRG